MERRCPRATGVARGSVGRARRAGLDPAGDGVQHVRLRRDHRRAREWLPDTIYISQYEDATTRLVSTYQEDIDVATTTLPGGAQAGENLAVWREQLVKAKWGDMDNHAVYLGWDADGAATTACYAIQLPAMRSNCLSAA